MIYGSETWAVTVEQKMRLERTERRMLRWMCGVSLRDKVSLMELRKRMGIESVLDVLRRGRLRWMGHVLRKDDDDWVKRSMLMEVVGNRGRGRPKMMWRHLAEQDMRDVRLQEKDAVDRARWRWLSWSANGQPLRQQGKTAVKRP